MTMGLILSDKAGERELPPSHSAAQASVRVAATTVRGVSRMSSPSEGLLGTCIGGVAASDWRAQRANCSSLHVETWAKPSSIASSLASSFESLSTCKSPCSLEFSWGSEALSQGRRTGEGDPHLTRKLASTLTAVSPAYISACEVLGSRSSQTPPTQ